MQMTRMTRTGPIPVGENGEKFSSPTPKTSLRPVHSFDHLVRGYEQRGWHLDAQRLRSLQT